MSDDDKKIKLVTPEARGSFVTLFRPRAFGEGEPKYSLTMTLAKDHPFWKKLKTAIRKAAEKRFDGQVPAKLKSPIRDGDDTDYEDFHGCYYVVMSSTEKPGIVDADLEDVTDRSEIYSGAWYRCSIRPYGWHYKDANRKGVSLQLDNVMKTKDDEAFSGKSSATDDFADHVDDEDDEDEDTRSKKSKRQSRGKDDDDEDERPRRKRGRKASRRQARDTDNDDEEDDDDE